MDHAATQPTTPFATRPASVWDREGLLERVDGDEELVGELVGLFLDDCPTLLANVREATVRRDADLLMRAAHTLKGTLTNLGGVAAVVSARRVEQLTPDGDWSGAEQAVAALEQDVDRFRQALIASAQRAAHG